jgi:hypothetical protein
MAGRSDFFHTSDKAPRLPRYLKKMLALMSTGDKHADGEVRRIFIAAHQTHVKFKLKRSDLDDMKDVGAVDVGNIDLSMISKNKESGVVLK